MKLRKWCNGGYWFRNAIPGNLGVVSISLLIIHSHSKTKTVSSLSCHFIGNPYSWIDGILYRSRVLLCLIGEIQWLVCLLGQHVCGFSLFAWSFQGLPKTLALETRISRIQNDMYFTAIFLCSKGNVMVYKRQRAWITTMSNAKNDEGPFSSYTWAKS